MYYRSLMLGLLFSPLCALPAFSQFTLEPGNPRVHETVYVRAMHPGGCDTFRSKDFTVAMSNNRITVVMPLTAAGGVCLPTPPPLGPVHLAIGQLPPGTYEVEVLTQVSGVNTSLGTRAFSVRPRVQGDPVANYTDLWWNPAASGWGLNVVQHPGNMIFATWFAYDNEGRPIWYVVPQGEWSAPDQGRNSSNQWFMGSIYRTSGPPGGAFDPARVTATLVGTAQFQFYEWDRMNALLTIDGRASQLSLQRQGF